MKSFYLSLLSIASIASAQTINLVAEACNESLDGFKVYTYSELGYGERTLYLGPDAETFDFADNAISFESNDTTSKLFANVYNDTLKLNIRKEQAFDVLDSYLLYNDDDQFTACREVYDDYGSGRWAVSYEKYGRECFHVKLRVVDPSESSAEDLKKRTVSDDLTILPVTETGLSILPVTETDSGLSILPVTSSESGLSILPVTSSESGLSILPVTSSGSAATDPATAEPSSIQSIPSSDPVANSTYDNGANKQMIGLSGFAVIAAFLL